MGTEAVGLHDIPGTHRVFAHIPAIGAGDSTIKYPIFSAQFTCNVTDVIIVPQAAVTGNTTNRKNLNVLDAGTAGAGTTEIGNLDLITSTDLVALAEQSLGVTDTELTDGDVLVLQIELVSGGVALPAMLVITEYQGA